MISPLLTCPQGCQRCQKIQKTKLKTTLITWSDKIQLKLNESQITFRKQVFFWQFLFNFDSFSQFLQFWLNLRFFNTPGTPGDMSIVEWNDIGHLDHCDSCSKMWLIDQLYIKLGSWIWQSVHLSSLSSRPIFHHLLFDSFPLVNYSPKDIDFFQKM